MESLNIIIWGCIKIWKIFLTSFLTRLCMLFTLKYRDWSLFSLGYYFHNEYFPSGSPICYYYFSNQKAAKRHKHMRTDRNVWRYFSCLYILDSNIADVNFCRSFIRKPTYQLRTGSDLIPYPCPLSPLVYPLNT